MSPARTNRQRRQDHHDRLKAERGRRLENGVYGLVREPVLPRGETVHHVHPSFSASHLAARRAKQLRREPLELAAQAVDLRCFYLGVPVDLCETEMDPLKAPWGGTRDHLVPARRGLAGAPKLGDISGGLVWCSRIANTTLGLAPLLVRLKIRQWLETTPYDRTDASVAAGHNLRWLLIQHINSFRVGNRLPWSRKTDGSWWVPSLQEPFMARMLEAERRFLDLDLDGKDAFVRDFDWRF